MDNYRQPQDCIPDDVIMLHIIKDYRKLLKANKMIADYAKKLETENTLLKDKLWMKSQKIDIIYKKYVEANRKQKRYRAYSEWLKEEIDKICGSYNIKSSIPKTSENAL